MVEQAVEQRGCDDRIAEDVAPLGKSTIGGEDHGAALVACGDELEEQVAAAGHDGQVADLVDDEQRGAGKEPDALLQAALAFSAGELAEQIGQGAEVDAPARLHRLDAERCGQMTFAGAGWSEEVHDLVAGDEPGWAVS